jgi:hypothetical protein
MHTLVHVLTRDDAGARALRLSLYRVNGTVETVDIGLTLPTRSVSHVVRLLELKLEALAAMQDAGFGFEAIGLAVTRAESMPARQSELNIDRHAEVRAQPISDDVQYSSAPSFEGHLRWPPQDDDDVERCAALIDALRQRLGPQCGGSRRSPVTSPSTPKYCHRSMERRFNHLRLEEKGRRLKVVAWKVAARMVRKEPVMMKRGSKQHVRCCCCRAPSRPRSPRLFPMVRRGVFAGAA